MLKYIDTKIVFQEIPNEITLAINISNCPCNCKGCHSSYLSKDIGDYLNFDTIIELYLKNKEITCISFMGGDNEPNGINELAYLIKKNINSSLLTAWYSGREKIASEINLNNFNFIKLGPYIEELGGLENPNTNQRLYKIENNNLINITNLFWKIK